MFGTILMQRVVSAALCIATLVGLPGCSALQIPEAGSAQTRPAQTQAPERTPPDDITFGTQTQRGFVNDNVYHSELGDIHFSSYIPESYDGSEPYDLFITLPGWEGLYFQGAGANIMRRRDCLKRKLKNSWFWTCGPRATSPNTAFGTSMRGARLLPTTAGQLMNTPTTPCVSSGTAELCQSPRTVISRNTGASSG